MTRTTHFPRRDGGKAGKGRKVYLVRQHCGGGHEEETLYSIHASRRSAQAEADLRNYDYFLGRDYDNAWIHYVEEMDVIG